MKYLGAAGFTYTLYIEARAKSAFTIAQFLPKHVMGDLGSVMGIQLHFSITSLKHLHHGSKHTEGKEGVQASIHSHFACGNSAGSPSFPVNEFGAVRTGMLSQDNRSHKQASKC